MREPLRLLQLSDLHVLSGEDRVRHGAAPLKSLNAIVASIQRAPPVDGIVLTGDLIHDDKPESYAEVAAALAPLGAPVWALAGNHDTPALFDAFPPPTDATLLTSTGSSQRPFLLHRNGWTLVFLDSRREGEIGGDLDTEQLRWLDSELARTANPTLLFVHHPPGPTEVNWVDKHGVIDADRLEAVLENHAHVKHLFFGHVHATIQMSAGRVPASSCPSTAYGFGDGVFTDVKRKDRVPQCSYRCITARGDRVVSHIVTVDTVDTADTADTAAVEPPDA